jgi:transposase
MAHSKQTQASKYTFRQFQAQYPDDDACLLAVFNRKTGPDFACPSCAVIGAKFHKITGRRAYACQYCGHHYYPCVGTPFEHSSTPLTLWFHAMYLMTATRNGVAAKELQRQLGVTYKCAWRIGHQLRDLMAARDEAGNTGPLTGHVEIDETYVGGHLRKFEGHGKGEYLKNKTTVMGLVERGGNVRTTIIANERRATMLPIVVANVAKGATVSTDTHGAYSGLKSLGYEHGKVNHNRDEWKNGIFCTNTIEGFWAHLKKGLKSTHIYVSPQHLQKYVDEFSFRYNYRKEPGEMFSRLLKQISA